MKPTQTTTTEVFPGRHPGRRFLKRETERLLRNPPSIWVAATVIVSMTTAVTVLAAVAMRIFDHREFPHLGPALWWAAQTVTTVGYGDIGVKAAVGRVIGVLVMLEGIAFLAVITAAITSTFVTRAQRELRARFDEVTLDHIAERLDRIERILEGDHPHGTMPPEGGSDVISGR